MAALDARIGSLRARFEAQTRRTSISSQIEGRESEKRGSVEDPLQPLRKFERHASDGGTSFVRMASTASVMARQVSAGTLLQSINVDISSSKGDAKHFVHKLPAKKYHIKRAVLKKLCVDNSWQERNTILTATNLAFSRVGTDIMLEAIPLREIKRVARTEGNRKSEWVRVRRGSADAVAPHGLEYAGLHGEMDEKMDEFFEERDKFRFGFEIETEDYDSVSSGRVYHLVADSEFEVTTWVREIRKLAHLQKQEWSRAAKLQTLQARTAAFYDHWAVQAVIAALIIASFVVAAAEAQIHPADGSQMDHTFRSCDLAFTIVFTLELFINLLGHWLLPFLRDGWNLLDTFVVAMSLLALGANEDFFPTSLRLVRILRMLKLFRILDSLRRIINALTRSILPVVNAMVVALIVTSIYCVVGVQLYREEAPEDFGTYARALFTMLQVTTFDNWGEIARTLSEQDGSLRFGPVFYFGSYILFVAWTLLPVVIAVLMENFTQASRSEERRMWELLKTKQHGPIASNPLDPLLSALSHYNSSAEQDKRIVALYEILSMDNKTGLGYETLAEGLRKLNVQPRIVLTKEDFDAITEGGALCDAEGMLDSVHFYVMMRTQFKQYMYRQISHESEIAAHESTSRFLTLKFLKMIMLSLDDVSAVAHGTTGPAPPMPPATSGAGAGGAWWGVAAAGASEAGAAPGEQRGEHVGVLERVLLEKVGAIEHTLAELVEGQARLGTQVGRVEARVGGSLPAAAHGGGGGAGRREPEAGGAGMLQRALPSAMERGVDVEAHRAEGDGSGGEVPVGASEKQEEEVDGVGLKEGGESREMLVADGFEGVSVAAPTGPSSLLARGGSALRVSPEQKVVRISPTARLGAFGDGAEGGGTIGAMEWVGRARDGQGSSGFAVGEAASRASEALRLTGDGRRAQQEADVATRASSREAGQFDHDFAQERADIVQRNSGRDTERLGRGRQPAQAAGVSDGQDATRAPGDSSLTLRGGRDSEDAAAGEHAVPPRTLRGGLAQPQDPGRGSSRDGHDAASRARDWREAGGATAPNLKQVGSGGANWSEEGQGQATLGFLSVPAAGGGVPGKAKGNARSSLSGLTARKASLPAWRSALGLDERGGSAQRTSPEGGKGRGSQSPGAREPRRSSSGPEGAEREGSASEGGARIARC